MPKLPICGNNTRKLHFEVNHADEVVFYECSAVSLLQISRQWIEDRLSICDLKCTQDTVNILARWYSQRILAPTFPTEFIDSLRSKDKRIKKLWKKSAVMNLSAVFIKINQKDKIFYLDIILSHRFEGKQHRQFHQESEDVLLNDFKSIFTVANKVEVKNVSLENEYQLSMIVLTTHQRFSPYHPSLDDIPADMSPSLLG